MGATLLITTLNRPDELRSCVRSIVGQTLLPEEIVVIDASEEPNFSSLEDLVQPTGIRLVHLSAERGRTRQLNIGIRTARCDPVIIVDDDVVLQRDFVRAMVGAFESDGREVGAIQGTMVNDTFRPPPFRALRALFLLPHHTRGSPGRLLRSGYYTMPVRPRHPVESETVRLGATGFRKHVLEQFTLDEALVGYALKEDIDLSYRVSRRYRVLIVPDARFFHLKTPTARIAVREKARMHVVNNFWFFSKHLGGSKGNQAAFVWSMIGRLGLQLCRSAIRRDPAHLLGTLDGFRDVYRSRRLARLRTDSRRVRRLYTRDSETGYTIAELDAARLPALLTSLFDGFSSAGVEWCLLRGEWDLTAEGGDIDLLVARHDRRLARRVAVAHGFAELTALGRGSHRFYVAYDQSSDRWFELDAVHDLRFGAYQTLRWRAEAECIAARQRLGDVFVLSPPHAFWTLLLHCLLDKGRIAPRHRDQLQRLAATGLIDEPLAPTLPGGMHPAARDPAILLRHVREGLWPELEDLAPLVASGLFRTQPLQAMARGVSNRLLRRLTRLALLWRRGLAVAVMGPDGSGKTTLAAALQSNFVLPVRIVYMGIHRSGSPDRDPQPMPLATRLLKNWTRYLTAVFHEARGRLVIFDRYPFEALLPPARPMGPLKRAGRWVLGRACPSPDVVVLLDAPADVMYRRKGDHSIETLQRRRQHYLELMPRRGEFHVVDATQNPHDVRRHVTALIWDAYRLRRHGARRAPRARVP